MPDYTSLNWTFSSLACPSEDLNTIVEIARSHGLDAIELRLAAGRADLPDYFSENFGSPAQLATWFRQQGVRVCALNTSLKLLANTAAEREAFLAFIPWAEALAVPYLRVFDGGTVETGMDASSQRHAIETLNWWYELKANNRWATDIMIETHDALVHSDSVIALNKSFGKPVPILWDTHHTWKKAAEPIAKTWNTLKHQIVHVHIKDSISRPSARHPFTYVQLGDGEFPIGHTLSLLDQERFSGYVSIEWERKWHPYLQPAGQALQRARDLGWW